MPLLVRNLHQRNVNGVSQKFCVGIPYHKAGHIAALHRPWTCTDANCLNLFPGKMGKQPAGKLRQAFDMGKNSIRLAKTQFPLLHGQKPGTVLAVPAIKPGNRGCIVAGINSDY